MASISSIRLRITGSGSSLIDGTYSDLIAPDSYKSGFNITTNNVNETYTSDPGSEVSLLNDEADVYDAGILDAYQSTDLNHFQQLDRGAGDFNDGDHYVLSYDTPILSTAGGFLFITERGGNNAYNIQAFDSDGILLGEINHTTDDYTDTGYQANNFQNHHAGIWPIEKFSGTPVNVSHRCGLLSMSRATMVPMERFSFTQMRVL